MENNELEIAGPDLLGTPYTLGKLVSIEIGKVVFKPSPDLGLVPELNVERSNTGRTLCRMIDETTMIAGYLWRTRGWPEGNNMGHRFREQGFKGYMTLGTRDYDYSAGISPEKWNEIKAFINHWLPTTIES